MESQTARLHQRRLVLQNASAGTVDIKLLEEQLCGRIAVHNDRMEHSEPQFEPQVCAAHQYMHCPPLCALPTTLCIAQHHLLCAVPCQSTMQLVCTHSAQAHHRHIAHSTLQHPAALHISHAAHCSIHTVPIVNEMVVNEMVVNEMVVNEIRFQHIPDLADHFSLLLSGTERRTLVEKRLSNVSEPILPTKQSFAGSTPSS